MISIDLRDKHLEDNIKAIKDMKELGFTDEEIQNKYDEQVKNDGRIMRRPEYKDYKLLIPTNILGCESDLVNYTKDLDTYCDKLEKEKKELSAKLIDNKIEYEELEKENRKLKEQNKKLFLLVNKQLEKERLTMSQCCDLYEKDSEDEIEF